MTQLAPDFVEIRKTMDVPNFNLSRKFLNLLGKPSPDQSAQDLATLANLAISVGHAPTDRLNQLDTEITQTPEPNKQPMLRARLAQIARQQQVQDLKKIENPPSGITGLISSLEATVAQIEKLISDGALSLESIDNLPPLVTFGLLTINGPIDPQLSAKLRNSAIDSDYISRLIIEITEPGNDTVKDV